MGEMKKVGLKLYLTRLAGLTHWNFALVSWLKVLLLEHSGGVKQEQKETRTTIATAIITSTRRGKTRNRFDQA